MELSKIIYILRSLKLGGILRTIQYGFLRDRIDRKYQEKISTFESQGPGEFQKVDSISSGFVLNFEHASVEVVFLSPSMLRISWEPGKPSYPYTIDKHEWELQKPDLDLEDEGCSITNADIFLLISHIGEISFFDGQHHLIRKDCAPSLRGKIWKLTTQLSTDERIFGLGERAGSLNLRPGHYTSWNMDLEGKYSSGKDPLYIGTPVYLSLSQGQSYLIYFENTYPSEYQIAESFTSSFSGGQLRYYVIVGSLENIYSQLSELIGFACLPPKWALGYHQSRWGYRSEADFRAIVKGFEEHELPLSALHLDIDYMDGFRVFSINHNRFPKLEYFAEELDKNGIKLVASINPAVKIDPTYDLYREGLSRDVFCKLPNGKIFSGVSWPGWSVFPDFTNPLARSWWGENYKSLIDAGIAGIWHDMNEPSSFAAWGDKTFPLSVVHSMDGIHGTHLEAHNIYGLLMNKAGYEALHELAPQKRPWIFSRSGWAGLQKYAWNWTGDVDSSWEALRITVTMLLGLGLSGHSFSGSDIGGFSGSPDYELYLRWFQMATFTPLFRTHSAVSTQPREPWVYGEPTTSIIRNFLRLRYELMPYIYTLVWQTCQTGVPPLRPIFWNAPQESFLCDVGDEFLLGENLLIAPVFEQGAIERQVTLPDGSWYSYWDNQRYPGLSTISLPVSLEFIPVLVKSGAIIPLQENGQLYLHLYIKDCCDSANWIYFDAGDGYGPSREDTFRSNFRDHSISISWIKSGTFPFPYPAITLVVHGCTRMQAISDGIIYPTQATSVVLPVFETLEIEYE